MQAMILAAGFGTRLRPYTDYVPKPLFPLFGRPLLLLHIDRLRKAGFDRIIINCHYKKEMIRRVVEGIDTVSVQEEEEILGTGGALKRAAAQLNDEPLLVVNSDIYHTIDPRWLYSVFDEQEAQVLLAVHDYPRFNSLKMTDGRIVDFPAGKEPDTLAFTGMHVLHPAVLEDIVDGRKSCIIEHYKSLLSRGAAIGAVRVDAGYWRDIGTPADYLNLHGDLLGTDAPVWKELEAAVGTTSAVVAPEARIAEGFSWHDWCVVGKAEIGKDVTICRSVVWDGAVVADGSVIKDAIIT